MTDTTVNDKPDYEVFDLVQFANDGKPLEFEKAFGDLMQDRIANLVAKRQEEESAGDDQEPDDGDSFETEDDEEEDLTGHEDDEEEEDDA